MDINLSQILILIGLPFFAAGFLGAYKESKNTFVSIIAGILQLFFWPLIATYEALAVLVWIVWFKKKGPLFAFLDVNNITDFSAKALVNIFVHIPSWIMTELEKHKTLVEAAKKEAAKLADEAKKEAHYLAVQARLELEKAIASEKLAAEVAASEAKKLLGEAVELVEEVFVPKPAPVAPAAPDIVASIANDVAMNSGTATVSGASVVTATTEDGKPVAPLSAVVAS